MANYYNSGDKVGRDKVGGDISYSPWKSLVVIAVIVVVVAAVIFGASLSIVHNGSSLEVNSLEVQNGADE